MLPQPRSDIQGFTDLAQRAVVIEYRFCHSDYASRYLTAPAPGCIRRFQAVSNWASLTMAVPMVPMAMAAASPANSMASRYDAPAEIASDRVAITVSPAPVTS